jgi:hypothetical protein
MIRHCAQSFTFHLIPSPGFSSHGTEVYNTLGQHQTSQSGREPSQALHEGFGTLVLTNKNDTLDRAMLVEVRPPGVFGSGVFKKFAKEGRGAGWWHVPAECCVGDAGQANLLQAQVRAF